jgi:AcrR family transcriptional regulator
MGLRRIGLRSAQHTDHGPFTSRVKRTTVQVVDRDLLGAPPVPERADAARNRRKVLAAADELFTARGVAAVSMDDVAAAAGVGKGTLYRRFGDKSGLASALLDEREAQLQQDLLGGPPPLGPGGEAVDRLAAFVEAYLSFVIMHLDLVAMSQTASPGARLRVGSHRLWVRHCHVLLAEACAPDPDVRADVLLAALTAEQVRHWTQTEQRATAALRESLVRLARTLASG